MKKKRRWLGEIIPILCGALYGALMIVYSEAAMDGSFSALLLMLAGMIFGLLAQVVLHELGHLVFGLATGYKFLSFRVGSLTLLKESEKLKFAKTKVAGTAGQCLLAPPEPDENGEIPYLLYNLGGALFNAACFLIFLPICVVTFYSPIAFCFATGQAFGALFSAVANGIPASVGGVDNDGKNIREISRSKEVMRAFRAQMKLAEGLSRGVSVEELDEELFQVPELAELGASPCGLILSRFSFACSRALALGEIEKCDELASRLLEGDRAYGIYKGAIVNDLIYCRLVSGDVESAIGLCDDEQLEFQKKSATNIGVLRTRYAFALLVDGDADGAAKILKEFDKHAAKHPYSSEVKTERSLLARVDETFAEREKRVSDEPWFDPSVEG